MDVVKLVQSMTDAEKDEVAKALEKEKKERKNNWTTEPQFGEKYWFINELFQLKSTLNVSGTYDKSLIDLGVCIENRAFDEELSRALWKFKLENDNVELDWEDNEQWKWFVVSVSNTLCVEATATEFIAGVTYFSTEEIAKRAIKEVVEPMLNMEM